MRIARIVVLAAACVAVLPLASQAQLIAGPGMGAKPPAQKPRTPPPPALPGAQGDSDRVAPLDKQMTDLPPTDALFDAINRGDIASARDAISRGADLRGHNLLGMTPMELSVDLGRNNITFLLLSMRGADSAPATKVSGVAAQPAAPKKPVRAERRTPPPPVREAATPAPRSPKLFAGDGGAPVPAAGFLGFDAGRGAAIR